MSTTATKRHPSQPRSNRWYDADDLRWAVRHWATRIGVKMGQTHLRPMKRKWASLSARSRLTLDTSLLKLPRELGEYVIVHELVHFLAPNHSKLFKSFMLAYMPDWEERDKRLQGSLQRRQASA
jgi:predicted metal-dependent hydrolase